MSVWHLSLAWLALQASVADKLDVGLDASTGTRPIFVRMEDQVFKRGGDFEQFCIANEKKPRSVVRKSLVGLLHRKADGSWKRITDVVRELKKKGSVRDVQRFWIVNGFACDADANACKALAARADVSFVYLQTGPPGLRQHQARRGQSSKDPKRESMKKAMKIAKDDSSVPFATKGLEIPWDMKQIQADQVWEKEGITGKGTVVALNDGGLYDLPCFESALWRNERELLNDKDDDRNGYIDDIFGWDAGEHSGYVLGKKGVSHGTMCGGIIAGRPTAGKALVTGVAPRTRLMLVNGMGYLSGFEYALTNGADVFSMSYMFVNMEIGNYRGVFRLAAEHMTAAGVLLCGGAGNFARSAPEGKQITLPKDIPCVLAVAGTLEDGSRPGFSSKGPVTWAGVRFYNDYPADKPLMKPDISAPAGGFACWNLASDIREQWKVVYRGNKDDVLITGAQGNSFAGPHAAGVAALMFSTNKEIHPWQVKRFMEETAKDMGDPGRDTLHGAGVIQALDAVRKAKGRS